MVRALDVWYTGGMKTCIASLLAAFGLLSVSAADVRVTDRGISGDGVVCQSAALKKLVSEVPDGTTLVFPAGCYFLSKAVPLEKKKGLTFRGEKGAVLKLHFSPWGPVSESNNGFCAQDCDGLTFENFTVTTDHPSSCAGRIVALDPANGTYDVQIDPEFPITGWEHFWGTDTCDDEGMPDYAIETYENVTQAEVPDGRGGTRTKYMGTKYELVAPQLIRVVPPKGRNFDFRRLHVGHRVLYRYIIYGSTVFAFAGCRDTVLRDIEIERCASMGVVVSPPSRNITFERFNMRVPKNSAALYCANADGIHILGLTGFLKMKDCHFLGLGDDALNIHGKAGEVKAFDPATGEATLICRNTKRQETRLPRAWAAAGEKLVVYDGKTFLTKGLVDVVRYGDDGRACIRAGGVDMKPGDVLANDKDFASVEITGCSVKNTRARGFLLQSRNMVVADCTFTGLSLPGLLISPDIRVWNEVGPTVNTEVRNCTFEKCGMNGSPANLGALTVKTSHDVHPGTDPAGVHRDIRIVGCRFTNCGNSGVFVSSTDGVKVRDNTFSRCSVRRFSEKNENTLYDIWLNNCANVSIDGNTTDKDAKYLSQVTEQTK